MHYFQFNIGDYKSHTNHLDLLEDLAYRRLLDLYYLHERPLNSGITAVARQIGMRDHETQVKTILEEFFCLTEDGWVNPRADREIQHYRGKIEQASRAGKASAERRSNARSTDVQPTNKQEPITNNHSKRTKGSRLSADWVLPKEWEDWARQERPDLNLRSVGEQFKDYWSAKTGSGATKLDWQATWRNWVRNQRAEKPNFTDVAKMTVPSKQERDPALVKLDEDRKKVVPPSVEVLEKLKMLRGRS